jgi:hypothetical protein
VPISLERSVSGGASAPTSLPSGANSGNNLPASLPSGSNEKIVVPQRRLSLVDADISGAVALMRNMVRTSVVCAHVVEQCLSCVCMCACARARTTGAGVACQQRLATGKR